jgi:Subtilase family
MSKIFFLFVLLVVFPEFCLGNCKNKPITVGVIDTGFSYEGRGASARLCKFGHKDFSPAQLFTSVKQVVVPEDTTGHGTNVVGIIESYLKSAGTNYCVVILKYYIPGQPGNLAALTAAFNYAADKKINYINYSGGGPKFSTPEWMAVERYLDGGGTLVTAAGNDGLEIDYHGYCSYPACYDRRIVVVGSLDRHGRKAKFSNFGNSVVSRWEVGLGVVGYGISMTGTSQATATATGKIISRSKNKCDIGE